jgi:hypothetical protein
MLDRKYQRKKHTVEKFIKKFGKVDHSVILNNVDVDYDKGGSHKSKLLQKNTLIAMKATLDGLLLVL